MWRANHLRVLLSLELARQTTQWSTHDGGHPPEARVTIAPDALLAFSARRSAEEAMLRQRFAAWHFHEVEYESLAAALPNELTRLQEFVGVEPGDLEPVLHKQTTGPLAERVVNYEALRTHFAGTEYAGWFDD